MLEVKDISKHLGGTSILENCSFSLTKGKTLALLGRSGSGKTTFLKILAGLEQADSGSVFLEKKDMKSVKTQDRNMLYLYQEALLFPHLTVFENIAFGLRLKKANGIKNTVLELLEKLDIAAHGQKMPHQISGGQKQRVAFGRAIAVQPKVLLLDEPFGALDSGTRSEMQLFYKSTIEQYGITSVFVTHDLKEALVVGDAFGFIKGGKLKNYVSQTEFLKDEENGLGAELAFWKQF